MKIKTLNENLQDYYEGEILGKSIILRDLLNIEFPLNALTNDLGEYLGYDEEDFTKEELDSRVIVTDIYTDADGFIGAEIKFENRDLNDINLGTVVKILQKDAPYNTYGKTGTVVNIDYYPTETWYQVQFDKPNPETPYETWVREQDLQVLNENTLNENATQYRLTLDIVDEEYDLNETLDFYLEEIGGALRVEEQLIKRGEWPIVTFQTTNKNELIELLDIYTGGDSADFLELIEEV